MIATHTKEPDESTFLTVTFDSKPGKFIGADTCLHFGTSSQIQRSGHVTLIKQISTFKLMLISTSE